MLRNPIPTNDELDERGRALDLKAAEDLRFLRENPGSGFSRRQQAANWADLTTHCRLICERMVLDEFEYFHEFGGRVLTILGVRLDAETGELQHDAEAQQKYGPHTMEEIAAGLRGDGEPLDVLLRHLHDCVAFHRIIPRELAMEIPRQKRWGRGVVAQWQDVVKLLGLDCDDRTKRLLARKAVDLGKSLKQVIRAWQCEQDTREGEPPV